MRVRCGKRIKAEALLYGPDSVAGLGEARLQLLLVARDEKGLLAPQEGLRL